MREESTEFVSDISEIASDRMRNGHKTRHSCMISVFGRLYFLKGSSFISRELCCLKIPRMYVVRIGESFVRLQVFLYVSRLMNLTSTRYDDSYFSLHEYLSLQLTWKNLKMYVKVLPTLNNLYFFTIAKFISLIN